jgi:uncharacterized iron-regulated protein
MVFCTVQGVFRVAQCSIAAILLVTATSAERANAQTPPPASRGAAMVSRGYVPNRVYDSRKKTWIDFETLVARANASDIVFVGEQHNDTPGHEMELALLEGIARRRLNGAPVVLSLEMFERDVQPELNAYLSGQKDEASFLKDARPWANYADDYRPLVELARLLHWPVVASDIPRPLAAIVSHGGLRALDTINAKIRSEQIATDISCPHDDYFKKFAEVMGGNAHGDAPNAAANGDSAKAAAAAATAMTQRFYEAQCVKDETMGESIARAYETARAKGDHALVVHMNGSFHTDYGLGTTQRTLKRVKDVKYLLISIVPVVDLDNVDAKSMRDRADYLVFTIGKPEN